MVVVVCKYMIITKIYQMYTKCLPHLICFLNSVSFDHYLFHFRQVRKGSTPTSSGFVWPVWFILATLGLLTSPCLVRFSISTHYFLFILTSKDPGTDAHLALSGITFLAVVLSAVNIVFDSFSHNLSALSEPTVACSSEPQCSVSLFQRVLYCQPFIYVGLWVLSCWLTWEHHDLHLGAIIQLGAITCRCSLRQGCCQTVTGF